LWRARSEIKKYLFAGRSLSAYIFPPMASLDQEQQWRQLKENYARMTEDELCAIAEDAYELTDVAREALKSVITERALDLRLNTEPPPPTVELPENAEMMSFSLLYSVDGARRAQNILQAAGILSYLGPEYVRNVDDFKGSFERGVELQIRSVDQLRAGMAFRQAGLQEPEEPQENQNFAVLCPNCHSEEIVFQGCDAENPKQSPMDSNYNWSCDACGYQWKDDGIEQEVTG